MFILNFFHFFFFSDGMRGGISGAILLVSQISIFRQGTLPVNPSKKAKQSNKLERGSSKWHAKYNRSCLIIWSKAIPCLFHSISLSVGEENLLRNVSVHGKFKSWLC